MPKKKFKVIKLLTEYSILINAGAEDGITERSIFDVIGNEESITDPDTGESLGQYYSVKATVKVRTLFPKIVECVNEQMIPEVTTSDIITAIKPFVITPERQAKLNIDKNQITGLSNSEEPIRIGDKVVLRA